MVSNMYQIVNLHGRDLYMWFLEITCGCPYNSYSSEKLPSSFKDRWISNRILADKLVFWLRYYNVGH